MMHSGYSKRPVPKDLVNVVNFDAPTTYNGYKENGQLVTEDNGSVLTLFTHSNQEDFASLELLQRKFAKNFGRQDMMQCLPLLWYEIAKPKSRVE
jgi:hypothetical protein